MELIKGQTAPAVWLAAVEHLNGCPDGKISTFPARGRKPTVLSKQDAAVYNEVDAFLKGTRSLSRPHSRGNHLPARRVSAWRPRGASLTTFRRRSVPFRKRATTATGVSYALRILCQKDFQGETFNPLENMVEKIKNHGKYRASFELGQGRPFEDDIPIYEPATDRKRLYGGPCLSHLSIKVHDGKVRFNATYARTTISGVCSATWSASAGFNTSSRGKPGSRSGL